MNEQLRKRLYSSLFNLASKIAPQDVRAVQNEVINRGLKAYEDARTVKTKDLPFMREVRRGEMVSIISHAYETKDWMGERSTAEVIADALIEAGYEKRDGND